MGQDPVDDVLVLNTSNDSGRATAADDFDNSADENEREDDKDQGEEDVACADYIASIITNKPLNIKNITAKVLDSDAAMKFKNTEDSDFPGSDLEYATRIDRFSFFMEVKRRNELLVMRAVSSI